MLKDEDSRPARKTRYERLWRDLLSQISALIQRIVRVLIPDAHSATARQRELVQTTLSSSFQDLRRSRSPNLPRVGTRDRLLILLRPITGKDNGRQSDGPWRVESFHLELQIHDHGSEWDFCDKADFEISGGRIDGYGHVFVDDHRQRICKSPVRRCVLKGKVCRRIEHSREDRRAGCRL